MDYLTAVRQATGELSHPGSDDLPAHVAIELVVHAWPHLAPIDPVWDLLAVDLLALRDNLYPDRAPIVLTVEPASHDSRTVRGAVGRLLLALADRYDHTAGNGTIHHRRRLQYAAAAIQVRRAARNLL